VVLCSRLNWLSYSFLALTKHFVSYLINIRPRNTEMAMYAGRVVCFPPVNCRWVCAGVFKVRKNGTDRQTDVMLTSQHMMLLSQMGMM